MSVDTIEPEFEVDPIFHAHFNQNKTYDIDIKHYVNQILETNKKVSKTEGYMEFDSERTMDELKHKWDREKMTYETKDRVSTYRAYKDKDNFVELSFAGDHEVDTAIQTMLYRGVENINRAFRHRSGYRAGDILPSVDELLKHKPSLVQGGIEEYGKKFLSNNEIPFTMEASEWNERKEKIEKTYWKGDFDNNGEYNVSIETAEKSPSLSDTLKDKMNLSNKFNRPKMR